MSAQPAAGMARRVRLDALSLQKLLANAVGVVPPPRADDSTFQLSYADRGKCSLVHLAAAVLVGVCSDVNTYDPQLHLHRQLSAVDLGHLCAIQLIRPGKVFTLWRRR